MTRTCSISIAVLSATMVLLFCAPVWAQDGKPVQFCNGTGQEFKLGNLTLPRYTYAPGNTKTEACVPIAQAVAGLKEAGYTGDDSRRALENFLNTKGYELYQYPDYKGRETVAVNLPSQWEPKPK